MKKNKILINFTDLPEERLIKFIEQDFETELESKLGIYVCFDGNAKIYYKGDFPHCYLYSKMFRRYKDYELEILSIEKYNEMIDKIKKI